MQLENFTRKFTCYIFILANGAKIVNGFFSKFFLTDKKIFGPG